MDTFNFDLKLLFPAFLKFSLYVFNPHKAKLPFLPDFNLNLKMWFFSIVILVLFLITSVTLPLSVRGGIRVGIANHISFFFAITLVSSVFLPELIFCVEYVVILFISPWHDFLWRLLKRFLFSIWEVLRRIPGVIITCKDENNQQDHEGETNPPLPQVEGVAVDIEMGGTEFCLSNLPQSLQAELLERRRLRKLWQKEQRVKGQANGVKVDLKDISADLLDNSPSAEISSSNALQTTAEHVPSPFKPVQTCSAEEDDNTEAQSGFNCERSDLGTFPNAERQTVHGNGRRPRWQMRKSQSFGRNGFYSTQNPQVRIRKPKMENEGKSMKSMLLTEDVAKADQHKTSEMMGFISVSLAVLPSGRMMI
ncbi:hypothetical protein RHMOL_Rhmol05G0051100 [Rhododendron molle]|uniref:Uncharacterized protein n=2 Tax=Rhododendron molle TaxID=49168 RepID=A0ACC0NKU5_RHOML|nr:hypothetical protein RHMOL_Rhmol05G0051100 [Rhododendron molle]KAI8553886.1 hypothetical protein RHMOL_Rhmol05G0051100 [Rhododendron molle]